jgi:phosphoribosyl 1,2-cyclic phosphodiesterase
MKFTSLASSSKGNAYLLQSDGASPLLLEAGLPIKQLRDKLRAHGVAISDLVGCLISHEHGDHSKAVMDLLKAGVDVYMSQGTANRLDVLLHHRNHIIDGWEHKYDLPGWVIRTFHLEHDAEESLGFFIAQKDDRLLFVPDTSYVENRFEGITIIAIECNNIAELVSQNILEGNIPAVVGKRVRRNHMSLENVIAMLKANDLSRCRTIYLMHLSDGNSDERRMIQEVQAATGIPTEAC